MALINDSVKSANAKVRFLRIAFGDAASSGTIAYSEIKDILANTYHGMPLKLIWAINTPLERIELNLLPVVAMYRKDTTLWRHT